MIKTCITSKEFKSGLSKYLFKTAHRLDPTTKLVLWSLRSPTWSIHTGRKLHSVTWEQVLWITTLKAASFEVWTGDTKEDATGKEFWLIDLLSCYAHMCLTTEGEHKMKWKFSGRVARHEKTIIRCWEFRDTFMSSFELLYAVQCKHRSHLRKGQKMVSNSRRKNQRKNGSGNHFEFTI